MRKLNEFGVTGSIDRVVSGPLLTAYHLKLDRDVKFSSVVRMGEDLALELSVPNVRVHRELDVVVIEVAKVEREIVRLPELLTPELIEGLDLPLAIGRLSDGRPLVVDLAKLPHLLVAGTTGSGKSVALHSMIVSLICKKKPEDVDLVLIDPKRVELTIYNDVPHVVGGRAITSSDEAVRILQHVVDEIDLRYDLMEEKGVRDINSYRQTGAEKHVPHLVVIVDEFSDLMMVSNKRVQDSVVRIAQVGRAAGVHLVLSTQRPTVDVITGLIKANIPTRIAFQVSSKIDSRTILDQSGAEALLGHGDMLYMPPGTATPERVHGAFVDDHEVHHVVQWLRAQGEPEYIEGVLEEVQNLGDGKFIDESGLPQDASEAEGGENAQLYDRAVAIVTQSRRASISGVQRHLRIGYNRAARLIEQMEREGVVSAPEHNGNRTVLAPPPPER